MSVSSPPSLPSSTPVDADYLILAGLPEGTTAFELAAAGPAGYVRYCNWYASRLDSRRLRNPGLSIETRLAAYLRLIGGQGQRFHLGTGAIPSARWLRARIDLHRNTIGKYIKDAQANKPIQLNLTVGCQLAFAAAIYPPQTKFEKNAIAEVLENRLDLIDDYYLTGRKKANMVRCLTPIIHTGKNELFTIAKSYPCSYNLDEKMLPVKQLAKHTPRRLVAKSM
ncbi:hypothetical protein [Aporhodopirellula aestuarii]|uniref:Homing endonuclease LAGLIDADG domain-containing protein n=1 Tax=Aporhodopirellula aestuarii TaxID=2950107 RepID=A0ABT0U682_9BACT|nr:hypothetical protein [Aporhodopirellula aestuarii]MCM2371903.1 hypothetical protein [Aporhodopirellula aestuarii]